ncbi:N-acetyldiaminopimelate deacetylase [Lentibacillus sp. CBA3610]|uniref:N-acetyldiaminopimelate deacetylase n=1 Tax=Lentibacillus sp. CBA3610 TaxID=2518176 RepID=UPI001595468B|nr:N-acetyldiaminopimelate deacetylase [Lentibacillus sp. CBA3610]QKY71377.1 N-acetyldiaminopimelate deacetylase [Lentibacillus sp. CBA3610]
MKYDWIEFRRQLHQIPELGFEEVKTQALLLNKIRQFPQKHLEIQTWQTGIFVKVNGTNPSKTIGWRTDMDGLPITEETGFDFVSRHEGKMHACGHDVHMSIALAVLAHFAQHPARDNLLFLFQPAEEGPGGALPMIESMPFKEWRPDELYALHIAPEYPAGTVATKKGLLFANTSELFIDLKGKGGHAAYPHTANDMVVAASYLVTQLQTIVSRNVDPLDSAVVTIGKITGGTRQNIIAEKARIEGTIRTLSQESMKQVKQRIEALVGGIEAGFSCEAVIDYGSNYLQVINDSELTQDFILFCETYPDMTLHICDEAMTGEDFGYFLDEIPGTMFWLGVHSEYGLHSAKLNAEEAAIPKAVDFLTGFLTHKADGGNN